MSQKGASKPSSGGLLKTLTYGSGMLLLDGVNAVTPHWAGAVDIMAVRQRDGSIQSSPFYVRFGKYQSWRRNRQVLVKVNGQLMDFTLELGSFGSAFFAHEQEQEVSPAAGDTQTQEERMDSGNLGMMSPVAAYEANYMSMVAASSPELPMSSRMSPSGLRQPPQPPPRLTAPHDQRNGAAANGMHGSRDGSPAGTPAVSSDGGPTCGAAAAHAVGTGAQWAPQAGSPPEDCSAGTPSRSPSQDAAPQLQPQLRTSEGPAAVAGEGAKAIPGDGVRAKHASTPGVATRRLQDVPSCGSINSVFVSGHECEDAYDPAAVGGHAAASAAASQPAMPDWHALDRSCERAARPGPSAAAVPCPASPRCITEQSGSCEVYENDTQRRPEAPAASQRSGVVAWGPPGAHAPPTVGVGHACAPDAVDHAAQSHPAPPGTSGGGATRSDGVEGGGVGSRAQAGEGGGAGAAGDVQRGSGEVAEEGRGYSLRSSGASLATLAWDMGWGEQEAAPSAAAATPSRPLSGHGVDVKLTVQADGDGLGERVHVSFSPWVRPADMSFSATQLATIRTSIDQPRGGDAATGGATSSAEAAAANGAGTTAGSSGPRGSSSSSMLPRSTLIFHPNAQPQVQSPGVLGPDALSPGHRRHVSFQDWDAVGGRAHSPAGGGDCDGTVLRASSPCAHRMRIGAEVMHGEEQEGSRAASLCGGVASSVDGARMTVHADTLRAAVAEEHEAESTLDHHAYQGMGPEVELAACAHLLVPDMPPSALAQLLEDHRVLASEVAVGGAAALPLERLAVRVGDNVYRYSDAQPLLLALLTFGGSAKQWQNLVPAEVYSLPPKASLPQPKAMQRRRTWWASIFFGASSQEATTEVLSAGRHGLLQENALHEHAHLAAECGASAADDVERFSTNAEEMQRAAGEMDCAEGALRLDQGGSGETYEMPMAVEGRLEGPLDGPSEPGEKRRRTVKVHSTHPTSSQLQAMAEHLQLGQNTVEFISGNQSVQSFIHLCNWNIRLVISDIDGTITRSDVLGHVLPPFGVDWSHPGVTRLFSNIAENGYQFVFLSSRSIAQSGITRAFLETLKQHDRGLPNGPVIISPHGIIPSLYREMILKRPQEFKMAALQGIRSLFPADWNPFYCGFGNRSSDDVSYLHVGVPPQRIFTINPSGKVRQLSEPETSERFDRLSKIDEQVDMLFPVTETARLRLFAQQVSSHSRTSQTTNDAAAAAVAAAAGVSLAAVASGPAIAARAAADALGGGSPTAAGGNEPTHDTSATTAAASTASEDGTAHYSASGERERFSGDGLSGASSPSKSGPININIPTRHTLESLRSLEGLQRFMSTSSTLAAELSVSSGIAGGPGSSPPRGGAARGVPAVDVDAREEFTDFNFWKMDGVRDGVSAELEEIIAQEEAVHRDTAGASPRPASGAAAAGKRSGWRRR